MSVKADSARTSEHVIKKRCAVVDVVNPAPRIAVPTSSYGPQTSNIREMRELRMFYIGKKTSGGFYVSIGRSYRLFYDLLFDDFANHLDSADVTISGYNESTDPLRGDDRNA